MNKFLPLVALYLGFSIKILAQITIKTISPTQNPLADSLVRPLVGHGISLFNIQSNLKPSAKTLGTFKNAGSFPLKSGLVLSTGIVDSIARLNRTRKVSTRQDLSADTLAGFSTGRQLLQSYLYKNSNPAAPMRATEISSVAFDFIPGGDSLRFRYLFASEEYPEFVCSQFNDIFGFYIKGPGIQGDSLFAGTNLAGYRNLAVLPQNHFPVSINTVNSGQPGSNGQSENCQFSAEGISRFELNLPGQNSPFQNFAFDGITKVLEAKSAVQACQTYSLILVIADVGDRIFDSGVFVEMGSFSSGLLCKFEPSHPSALGDTLSRCNPGRLVFSRCPQIQENWVLKFTTEGNAQIQTDFVFKNKTGQILAVTDSLVFHTGDSNDTLFIEPISDFSGSKWLKINFLNIRTPFVIGQPQLSDQGLKLVFKSKSHYLPDWQGVCPGDSFLLASQGLALSHFQYTWKQRDENQWIPTSNIGNPNCMTPKIWPARSAQWLMLETKNPQTQCEFRDSILVERFVRPQPLFQYTGLQVSISGVPEGFSRIWKVNGLPSVPDSAGFLTFISGDSISLELISPQNCHFYYSHSTIFSSSLNSEKWETLRLIPNPAVEEVEVKISDFNLFDFTIENRNGQAVEKGNLAQSPFISLKKLPSGIYFLHLKNKEGARYVKRLVKT